MRLDVAAVALTAILLVLSSACGSHRGTHLGFQDCVDAWNGSARRERVAHLVRAGYKRAGIQLSLTPGQPVRGGAAEPQNPVGCRVILFNRDMWVAFVARRDGDRFRFRRAMLGAEGGDQSGLWPDAAMRGPHNAKLLANAKLALAASLMPIPKLAAWKRLMDDWFVHGRVEGRYSCNVAQAAVEHLPGDGPEIGAPVRAYESKVC
jgi:hypothetical protein